MYIGKPFILAGHHNRDPGAIGYDGEKEAEVTKRFADMVIYCLRRLDPNIEVYRDNDNDTLSTVIRKIRPIIQENDVLVEYHVNSVNNPMATGSEVFVSDYAGKGSIALAHDLNHVTHSIIGINDRGVKKESESNRGKLGILGMRGRACLVELYFNSNEYDTHKFREKQLWLANDHAEIIKYHISNKNFISLY